MTIRPRYECIEFCRNPETLWAKLEEGRWDWLGVHPDGQFVLGAPPAGGELARPVGIIKSSTTAPQGDNGVTIQEPTSPQSGFWFETEDEAAVEFDRRLAEVRADDAAPRVVRLRLFQGRRIAREEFVVHRPSTYR